MNTLVLGLQWGDEGKGKAIDCLASGFDVVVRFQGGHNAGHTIYVGERKVVLHLLPSGIFSPSSVSVIGNGVVVDPRQLLAEIDSCERVQLDLGKLVLSESAPLIFPFHQELDVAYESARCQHIGTTRRGIGPAYEDHTGRRSLFVRDLLDGAEFRRRITPLHDASCRLIEANGGTPPALDSYLNDYLECGRRLASRVTDTRALLYKYWKDGKRILYEGAQGTLLDIHFGTYPFVTSSMATVAGVFAGTGLPHQALQRVIGISKAYATRVGEGPFPTELAGDEAEALRKRGGEYGATTGRPRRVGWLDLPALRYAVEINGVDRLFLTKLDVLDGLPEIPVAVDYRDSRGKSVGFSPLPDRLATITPVWRSLPGWKEPAAGCRDFAKLPGAARHYISFIEDFIGISVGTVSTGATRADTIVRS